MRKIILYVIKFVYFLIENISFERLIFLFLEIIYLFKSIFSKKRGMRFGKDEIKSIHKAKGWGEVLKMGVRRTSILCVPSFLDFINRSQKIDFLVLETRKEGEDKSILIALSPFHTREYMKILRDKAEAHDIIVNNFDFHVNSYGNVDKSIKKRFGKKYTGSRNDSIRLCVRKIPLSK